MTPCPACGRTFVDPVALRQHKRARHPTPAQAARKARLRERDAAIPDTPPQGEDQQ